MAGTLRVPPGCEASCKVLRSLAITVLNSSLSPCLQCLAKMLDTTPRVDFYLSLCEIDVAAPEIDVIKSKPLKDNKAVKIKNITKYI